MNPAPLLDVRGLTLALARRDGREHPVVDGVSFAIARERTLGLVGESGCGKTLTSLALLRLEPSPPVRVAGGSIELDTGEGAIDIAKLDPRGRAIRALRGRRIAMIFQEPMTSLDPVYAVGEQIAEAARLHHGLGRKAAAARAVEMLDAVGIPAPAQRAREYPFQLSGGMRQRAMIAMALVGEPDLLIADEPTTALDVTVQAQVLELMNDLKRRFRNAILFISHDLGVIANMADDVAIMYLGRIVEQAPVRAIFRSPGHPYTQGLLASLPSAASERGKLQPIAGTVPVSGHGAPRCGFAERCPHVMPRCRVEAPPLIPLGGGQAAACWLHA